MRVILASASPRRRELLILIGLNPEIEIPDVDESRLEGETVESFLKRVAIAKGLHIFKNSYFTDLIVSADTIVLLEDRVIGKPGSREEAKEMLEFLSGREHQVWTGVSLIHRGETRFAVSKTKVRFRRILSREIDFYLDRADYMDKAGAYAIQGRAAVFVEGIDGCYFNVMGFPLSLFYRMAGEMGISLFEENFGIPRISVQKEL